MEFVVYLVLGTFVGVLAGLFGVGGGMIIVPALIFSFTAMGVDPAFMTHLAVGTSLATIVFTSINSVRAHHKRGAVNWPVVRWMTLGLLAGVGLGSLTAASLQGEVLQKIIGTFAICVAAQMAFNLQPRTARPLPGKAGLSVAGGVIGWASSIFGIGGGSLTVPFLAWRSLTMQQAVATSAACGMPIALAGALGFMLTGWSHQAQLPEWSVGFVYLPALIGIATTSMLSARLGVHLAHRLPAHILKRLFALLMLGVGLNFLL